MQIYFMNNIFSLSLAFHARKKKRCRWIQKALKSRMKIENITSVHNYFMLHVSCSTKSQWHHVPVYMTCQLVGGEGGGAGLMYRNSHFSVVRGSLLKRLRQSLSLWNETENEMLKYIMGVPACSCDADSGSLLKHWIVPCKFDWIIVRGISQFWFNVPSDKESEGQILSTSLLYLSRKKNGWRVGYL